MKTSTPLKSFLYLVFALICVSSIGCGPNFGEKLVLKETEVYYKDGATLADAQRLVDKLDQLGFVDGNAKSVQLLKPDDVWQFRMAIGKGGDAEVAKKQMKLYCLELSSAFDGAPVDVHFCNQKLESKSIIKGLRGNRYQFINTVYYYDGVDLATVKGFAELAYATGLDGGVGSKFHLSKPGSTMEIRMAHPTGTSGNKQIAVAARATAAAVSSKLFAGKQVDVLICNNYFDSLEVFSSLKQAAPASP